MRFQKLSVLLLCLLPALTGMRGERRAFWGEEEVGNSPISCKFALTVSDDKVIDQKKGVISRNVQGMRADELNKLKRFANLAYDFDKYFEIVTEAYRLQVNRDELARVISTCGLFRSSRYEIRDNLSIDEILFRRSSSEHVANKLSELFESTQGWGSNGTLTISELREIAFGSLKSLLHSLDQGSFPPSALRVFQLILVSKYSEQLKAALLKAYFPFAHDDDWFLDPDNIENIVYGENPEFVELDLDENGEIPPRVPHLYEFSAETSLREFKQRYALEVYDHVLKPILARELTIPSLLRIRYIIQAHLPIDDFFHSDDTDDSIAVQLHDLVIADIYHSNLIYQLGLRSTNREIFNFVMGGKLPLPERNPDITSADWLGRYFSNVSTTDELVEGLFLMAILTNNSREPHDNYYRMSALWTHSPLFHENTVIDVLQLENVWAKLKRAVANGFFSIHHLSAEAAFEAIKMDLIRDLTKPKQPAPIYRPGGSSRR